MSKQSLSKRVVDKKKIKALFRGTNTFDFRYCSRETRKDPRPSKDDLLNIIMFNSSEVNIIHSYYEQGELFELSEDQLNEGQAYEEYLAESRNFDIPGERRRRQRKSKLIPEHEEATSALMRRNHLENYNHEELLQMMSSNPSLNITPVINTKKTIPLPPPLLVPIPRLLKKKLTNSIPVKQNNNSLVVKNNNPVNQTINHNDSIEFENISTINRTAVIEHIPPCSNPVYKATSTPNVAQIQSIADFINASKYQCINQNNASDPNDTTLQYLSNKADINVSFVNKKGSRVTFNQQEDRTRTVNIAANKIELSRRLSVKQDIFKEPSIEPLPSLTSVRELESDSYHPLLNQTFPPLNSISQDLHTSNHQQPFQELPSLIDSIHDCQVAFKQRRIETLSAARTDEQNLTNLDRSLKCTQQQQNVDAINRLRKNPHIQPQMPVETGNVEITVSSRQELPLNAQIMGSTQKRQSKQNKQNQTSSQPNKPVLLHSNEQNIPQLVQGRMPLINTSQQNRPVNTPLKRSHSDPIIRTKVSIPPSRHNILHPAHLEPKKGRPPKNTNVNLLVQDIPSEFIHQEIREQQGTLTNVTKRPPSIINSEVPPKIGRFSNETNLKISSIINIDSVRLKKDVTVTRRPSSQGTLGDLPNQVRTQGRPLNQTINREVIPNDGITSRSGNITPGRSPNLELGQPPNQKQHSDGLLSLSMKLENRSNENVASRNVPNKTLGRPPNQNQVARPINQATNLSRPPNNHLNPRQLQPNGQPILTADNVDNFLDNLPARFNVNELLKSNAQQMMKWWNEKQRFDALNGKPSCR